MDFFVTEMIPVVEGAVQYMQEIPALRLNATPVRRELIVVLMLWVRPVPTMAMAVRMMNVTGAEHVSIPTIMIPVTMGFFVMV